MSKLFFIIPILGLFLLGCKTQQSIPGKKLANKKYLPTLLNSVEKSEFNPDWMAVKTSVDFEQGGSKKGFKANIRLKKDSVIWISITPIIGVELARVVFSPDSVKMVNRLEGNYFLGNYEFINTKFNADFNFETIQALILGNSLNLDENENLVASIDEGVYLLSGLNKRRLRKSLEKEEGKKNTERVYSAWIDPISFKITKQSFADFEEQQYLTVNYANFKTIQNSVFPFETNITLEAQEIIKINISYSSLEVNEPKKVPFSISSKYEPVKF